MCKSTTPWLHYVSFTFLEGIAAVTLVLKSSAENELVSYQPQSQNIS